MFSRPALGLAEVAWRWTFGFAAVLAFTFLTLEYFRTLPVGPGDLFLLRTRHPLLISQAVAHIFRGSAARFVRALFLLFVLLSAAWIVLASLARRSTVSALLTYFWEDGAAPGLLAASKIPRHAPFGLNCLRVVVMAAALFAFAGALLLATAASTPTDPSPGAAMLVFLTLAMGISLAWWLLNWILSLAAIFVVADGSGTLSAISQATELWRVRWGSITAAGTWFGIAHGIIFFIASISHCISVGICRRSAPGYRHRRDLAGGTALFRCGPLFVRRKNGGIRCHSETAGRAGNLAPNLRSDDPATVWHRSQRIDPLRRSRYPVIL